ncbi:MAG: carbohydrate ABC transporter permease [Anaerolineae bacterium]
MSVKTDPVTVLSLRRTLRTRLPSGVRLREWRDGWLLASPFLVGVLAFWVGPMLYSLFLTTQDWDMLHAPAYIGLGNAAKMLRDPLVKTSLWNTAYYTFLSVPLNLALAFALAVALNQRLAGQSIYRTVFYLPSIVPAVATAVVWSMVFNPEFGILNSILGLFGIEPVKWLFDTRLAKPAFIFMRLWGMGPQMIIMLAALQNVPQEVLEAAQIDGASSWARFRHVTIPMVSPALFFNLIMGIIGSFQVFTASFIMTRGGPQNATLFAVLYIYENGFHRMQMGYAATLSWLLFGIIMLFTLIQLKVSRSWVYYEV